MSLVSIILPSYNEELMIETTALTIGGMLSANGQEYELVFIDDGSSDRTWNCIDQLARSDDHICGVKFSRNFGKEAAILAGLANAKGDCCIVMDCDLQHPPETVLQMLDLWKQGYEIVEGVKTSRGTESHLHRCFANMFYKMISYAVGIDMSRASDFKLLDRKVVETLLNMPEQDSFFRALSSWVGFEKTQVEFAVVDRIAGESKWSTHSLIRYAIRNITAFSTAPMLMVAIMGGLFLTGSIVLGIQTFWRYFHGMNVEGFTTVILLILLTGSILMISLGMIGYYIAKIYEEVKRRPRYIVSKVLNRGN